MFSKREAIDIKLKSVCCKCGRPLKDMKVINVIQSKKVAEWEFPVYNTCAVGIVCNDCLSDTLQPSNDDMKVIEYTKEGEVRYHSQEDLKAADPKLYDSKKLEMTSRTDTASIPGDKIEIKLVLDPVIANMLGLYLHKSPVFMSKINAFLNDSVLHKFPAEAFVRLQEIGQDILNQLDENNLKNIFKGRIN